MPSDKRSMVVEGEIIRATEDIENNQAMYITVREADGSIKLKCIHRTEIHDVPVIKPQQNLNVVLFQYRGEDSLLMVQNGNKLMMYKQVSDTNNGP